LAKSGQVRKRGPMPPKRAPAKALSGLAGSMLVALDARVRDIRQAPDGSIYIAVERDTQQGPGSTRQSLTGSVLRIDPAN
jgi:glucose/arabinose dehydrogenase